MDDRRRARRYRVWFPMRFEGAPETGLQAVSRNISKRGMLMATARELAENSAVTLIFRVALDDPTQHKIPGRIVRAEQNADDPQGLWPHWVAVEFDQPADELVPLLEEAEEWPAEE